MKTPMVILSLVLTSLSISATPIIVGGTAPLGDANAWIEQKAMQRFPQSTGSFYKNKVLPVAPAVTNGGSFPNAAGMILFYHNDNLGIFRDTMRDFTSAGAQAAIASPEYFADYYYPDDTNSFLTQTDKSGSFGNRSENWANRPDNCIADLCQTSQSYMGLRAGWTLPLFFESYSMSGQSNGKVYQIYNPPTGGGLYWLERHVKIMQRRKSGSNDFQLYVHEHPNVIWDRGSPEIDDEYWAFIKQQIDRDRPLIGILSAGYSYNIPRSPAVAIVGYAEDEENRAFAAYNGDSWNLQWYSLEGKVLQLIFFMFDDETTHSGLVENAVHRFFNPATGAYFFTAFTAEAQNVIDNNKAWEYQGPVFRVEYGETEANTPVYRFYNQKAGAHFYTANEQEKENVIANLSANFSYEGIAFYVRSYAQPFNEADPNAPTYYPIYRCYLPQTSSHYFTASKAEVDFIQQFVDPSLIRVEGIAWYSDYIWDVK